MKLKLPKIKVFQVLLSLKYFYILIAVLIIVVLGVLGWFLYKNLYQTIAQTEQIILLRKEVAPDTINMEKVNTVLKFLDKKIRSTSTVNWTKIKNPFTSFSQSQPASPQEESEPQTEE